MGVAPKPRTLLLPAVITAPGALRVMGSDESLWRAHPIQNLQAPTYHHTDSSPSPIPVAHKGKMECDRAPLFPTDKTQGAHPTQRVIRATGQAFGIKKPRTLAGSYETARYPDYQGPEWEGVTVFAQVKGNRRKSLSFPKNDRFNIVVGSAVPFHLSFLSSFSDFF